jgi:hypothetical protein
MSAALNYDGHLLMPKATAVWMIENTALTFRQIADFTELTEIEIEALANEEIGRGLVGRNPVDHKEITKEELERCEKDPAARLLHSRSELPQVKLRAKGPRYTPVSKRGDKPDAIAYILKNNPEISHAQICKLVGTTKPTILNVRDKSHPNSPNIKPRHPAELGLCSYKEYEAASDKGFRAQGKDPEAIRAQRQASADALKAENEAAYDPTDMAAASSSFDFSNFLSKPSTPSYDEDDDQN